MRQTRFCTVPLTLGYAAPGSDSCSAGPMTTAVRNGWSLRLLQDKIPAQNDAAKALGKGTDLIVHQIELSAHCDAANAFGKGIISTEIQVTSKDAWWSDPHGPYCIYIISTDSCWRQDKSAMIIGVLSPIACTPLSANYQSGQDSIFANWCNRWVIIIVVKTCI